MQAEHVDVLIVGAGLSGIGAACHLQERCPGKTFAILEAREDMGGTWDLFRYPGVRSDSDMFTLGYCFRPWDNAKAIADGPSILRYVHDTARDYGVEDRIHFNHKVLRAQWSSENARWAVEAERGDTGETVTFTCGFLYMCTGYYSYDEGYTPQFAGAERFAGQIIHPQHWPEDLDYTGKRVAVIGSGATAVTLVPAMADKAAHVTMVQRSPTYVVTLPGNDGLAEALQKRVSPKLAYALYDPWDQRMCLVPDGDLFEAISEGRASIVTDGIETFTETGLRLASGEQIEADIIVTATGLNLLPLGGIDLAVDGSEVRIPETVGYKGMMLSGIPNLAVTLGYTNASWTLKADLVAQYTCRLLNYMDAHGYATCTPRAPAPGAQTAPWLDLKSGYVLRSAATLPKQGMTPPWRLHQNYLRDIPLLRRGPVDDEMEFAAARPDQGQDSREPASIAA